MNIEDVFRAFFWTLLVSMFLMRFWFGLGVWRSGERIRAERGALQREGLCAHVVEYLFFLLLAALIPLLWFQGGSLRNFAFSEPVSASTTLVLAAIDLVRKSGLPIRS